MMRRRVSPPANPAVVKLCEELAASSLQVNPAPVPAAERLLKADAPDFAVGAESDLGLLDVEALLMEVLQESRDWWCFRAGATLALSLSGSAKNKAWDMLLDRFWLSPLPFPIIPKLLPVTVPPEKAKPSVSAYPSGRVASPSIRMDEPSEFEVKDQPTSDGHQPSKEDEVKEDELKEDDAKDESAPEMCTAEPFMEAEEFPIKAQLDPPTAEESLRAVTPKVAAARPKHAHLKVPLPEAAAAAVKEPTQAGHEKGQWSEWSQETREEDEIEFTDPHLDLPTPHSSELDELEAQISVEAERVQKLEQNLMIPSPADGADSDTEEESPNEAQGSQDHLQTEATEGAGALEVIQRLGISAENLLVAPATPPMPKATAAPRTPPLAPEGLKSSLFDQFMTAPVTPPRARDPKSPKSKRAIGASPQVIPTSDSDWSENVAEKDVTMFASSLEELVQQSPTIPVKASQRVLRQHSIFQWALLSRLGIEVWGEAEEEGVEEEPTFPSILQMLPCFGGRRALYSGSLPSTSLPDLGPLLRCREAVEALLLSGGCRDWVLATAHLCRLLRESPSLLQGGWQLQLAVATSLCMAEGREMMDSSFHESAVDFFKRYQHYCANAVAKELFPEFRSLKAWHFRYVLGSWHSDDDLAWSRANVSKEYKKPDATMPRILSYGGVCGAVSKFGASCCQAFGVPAMPVGQPGHCAMIWRGPGGRWCLENDNGGWNQSWMHDKIQRTWPKELGRFAEHAGVIPVAERAIMSGKYSCSESQRLAAKLSPLETAAELLINAVLLCPDNLCAWVDLLAVATPQLAPMLHPRVEALEALAASGPWQGGRELSLNCPVRASADVERAGHVVDGTDSEWFPTEAAPQWLEIDLKKLSQVDRVRVKWWGDYGKKSSLRVLSLLWDELPGWEEPTRAVRLELDQPCPDCFGLSKSYGIRRVEVLGHHIGTSSSLSIGSLLTRLAEASFPSPQELADQQGLRIVTEMLKGFSE
eukprot:g8811.t1